MEKLRQKSLALTGYLEALLMEEFVVENREYPSGPVAEKKRKLSKANKACNIRILTPSDPNQRGCQLSLKFSIPVEKMQSTFLKHGIVCDSRKPDVIRIAPAPLYNSFQDVWQFVNAVKEIMNKEGALSIENGS